MVFPIILFLMVLSPLFLMVLSPLFIPVAVTVVDMYDNWRTRRAARPVRKIRPAVGLRPAPACCHRLPPPSPGSRWESM